MPHNAHNDLLRIAGCDPVPSTWLTAVLRDTGALTHGAIIGVAERPNATAFNSIITHLTLTYSPDAPADAPTRLLLKRNLSAAWAIEDAEREVGFYRTIMPLADHLPMLVHCYGAAFEAEGGTSYLLLDDLSETHVTPISRERVLALDSIPSEEHIHGVIDALARFHTY